jgi:hypothetical protein
VCAGTAACSRCLRSALPRLRLLANPAGRWIEARRPKLRFQRRASAVRVIWSPAGRGAAEASVWTVSSLRCSRFFLGVGDAARFPGQPACGEATAKEIRRTTLLRRPAAEAGLRRRCRVQVVRCPNG